MGDVSGGRLDTCRLKEWLNEDVGVDISTAQWNLTLDNVNFAIQAANNSAPGPDGIPCSNHRFYPDSAKILLATATALQADNSRQPPDFNLANMSCLPKNIRSPFLSVARKYTAVTPLGRSVLSTPTIDS